MAVIEVVGVIGGACAFFSFYSNTHMTNPLHTRVLTSGRVSAPVSTPNALLGCSQELCCAMTLVSLRGSWTHNPSPWAFLCSVLCVTARILPFLNRMSALVSYHSFVLLSPGAVVLLKSGGCLYQTDSHKLSSTIL